MTKEKLMNQWLDAQIYLEDAKRNPKEIGYKERCELMSQKAETKLKNYNYWKFMRCYNG